MKKINIRIIFVIALLVGITNIAIAGTNVHIRNATNYCGQLKLQYVGPSSGYVEQTFLAGDKSTVIPLFGGLGSTLTKVQLIGAPNCGGTPFTGVINCTINASSPLKNQVYINMAINGAKCLYCTATNA
ncbi:hypothetical protein [Legionella nagasakiensis]|uniref:hypothetical protein n=1 Tax=Legionella nagasakiensis TaxID=535290 RepID=UPI0010567AA5|nr:hypothetical protein [Legionella nagasakiensis]